VLIALFAVIALTSAAVAADAEQTVFWIAGVLEFLSLSAIALLVVVNYAERWHERWISYRLFAELCRKQRVLALVGQSLPGSGASQLALDVEGATTAPRDSWIAWLFMAHRRAMELPIGKMADRKLPALRAGLELVEQQIDYHSTRRDRASRAGESVRRASEIFFVLAIVFAVAKFGAVLGRVEPVLHWIVLVGAFTSAAAGALVSVTAYAEFALLARQSAHMLRILRPSENELDALKHDIEKPLASLRLGRTLFAATTAMMQDITGWAHLFRVKALETG
jgi:hypothetical protein